MAHVFLQVSLRLPVQGTRYPNEAGLLQVSTVCRRGVPVVFQAFIPVFTGLTAQQ